MLKAGLQLLGHELDVEPRLNARYAHLIQTAALVESVGPNLAYAGRQVHFCEIMALKRILAYLCDVLRQRDAGQVLFAALFERSVER